MKIIYYTNKVIFILTLILYLTVFLGLYSQIALGAIQVISALILFYYWKKFNSKTKKQLYLYWALVIFYGLIWLNDTQNLIETYYVIVIMLIPMSIASYFFYILNSVKKLK